ncbi:GntR family transcriptional regulator [Brevibacterium oceani]|uniref:GntR family transcriptional regulator n=1 Tax=Brevibacterium oceani TaxID=358099 RepID=UPI001B339417|nr:GntR family transcriptional regulator [Brevibacterium oceani]
MAHSKHGTRADTTYESIRSDILAGRHQPGARLKFSALCERYDAGVGVVREALSRLAEQGLVNSQPHLGFQVVSLSADDLCELTDARIEIEGMVLRHSIEEGDVGWESGVISAHHRLERTCQYDQDDPARVSDAWSEAHREFHLALLGGCRNSRLRAVAASLRDSAELYQLWSQQVSRHPQRDVQAEHRGLLNLAIDRDVEKAVSALTEHISRTTEILLSHPDATSGRPETAAPI